jgi:hypothetical protein
MLKITDSLYIRQNEIIDYVSIVKDLSGGFCIVLKAAGQNSVVNSGYSIHTSFPTLLPKLRTIASSLGLTRLTETLYVRSANNIRMVYNDGGFLRVQYNLENLLAWPLWLPNNEITDMIKEIVNVSTININ